MTNALPDIRSKISIDDSQLKTAAKTSATSHAAFQAHAAASSTSNLRFTQSLTTMLDKFGGMPPVLNEAGRSLESMSSQGVSGMTMLGGAALAGLGLVAEGAKMAIDTYTKLGDEVENYKRVVGGSAQDAGRMVQTFEALGVSGDTATSAMFKLSKAIETSPAKLEALGVVVAHDAQGNINLSKTLLSVADAYNATADQGRKNTIVFDAFGRSGRDMIPVLEQGSAAIQQLEASAALTFTDADLQRLKDYKIAQTEAKQSFDAWWASIGQQGIPIIGGFFDSLNRGTKVSQMLRAEYDAGRISQDEFTGTGIHAKQVHDDLIKKFLSEIDASDKLTHATNLQAQAMQDEAAKADALSAELDKFIGQTETAATDSIALQRANLAVAESQGKVDVAAQAYSDAIAKYGQGSKEAKVAGEALSGVYLDQEQAYINDAKAARTLQEATDIATLGHKEAALEAKAYIDKLKEEASTLAPDSPLRVYLQGLIDQYKDVPRDLTTTFHVAGGGNLPSYLQGPRAAGGPVAGGGLYTVGEQGPELFVPNMAGTIVPHGMAEAAAAAAARTPDSGGGLADLSKVESLLEQSSRLLNELIGVTIDNKPPAPPNGVDFFNAIDRATGLRMRGFAGA